MKYYMPTLVYHEKNCVKNHQKEMALFGKKALIVTGKHSSRINGSLEDVQGALKEEEVEFLVFDSVEENPSMETCQKAADFAKNSSVDFVIGIGGGSPLDAAKAIALLIANPDRDQKVLYESIPLPSLPVVMVPTTAGTGSEVTPYAVLTIHARKTKKSISHRIYPKLALCDAKYLQTAKREVLTSTAVDTLAHLIESYGNTNSDVLNRMCSEYGMKLWGQVKGALKEDTLSEIDYERLLEASTVAGMAITHTSTSLPHGLSYPLTYELGVAHGKACGRFLPGYLKVYAKHKPEEVANILAILGYNNIEEFEQFLQELLGEIPFPADLKEATIEKILLDQAKLANCPFPVTRDDVILMCE